MADSARPEQAAQDQIRAFDKKHLEPEQLMEKLRKQGMTVESRSALPYLRHVGGYRMKGYWYQWQDSTTKTFREGVHFDQVIRRYEFDRELRRITSDALERIELMVRTVMSNVLSRMEGPHWFMNEALFSRQLHGKPQKVTLLEKVREEVERVRDKPFIAHYRMKYDSPPLPPSWAVSECLSFGSWAHAYPRLADASYRKEISRRFGVEASEVFETWLHAFSVLRNTVAHHGRLLGAQTSVTPGDYRYRGLRFNKNRTFFVTATVINYVSSRIGHGPQWRDDLQSLIDRFPEIPIHGGLGFPPDWREQPGWVPSATPKKKSQDRSMAPRAQRKAPNTTAMEHAFASMRK